MMILDSGLLFLGHPVRMWQRTICLPPHTSFGLLLVSGSGLSETEMDTIS